MSDTDDIRNYLAGWGDTSWAKPDNVKYIAEVATRMATLRREHPDGDFPSPTHGIDDIGACAECDALRVLASQEDV
jgi:hypothetical protein